MIDLTKLVKPLVWRDSYGVFRAETVFGDYKVLGRVLRLPSALQAEMVCESSEAAQAAANADNAARTLAALDQELLGELLRVLDDAASRQPKDDSCDVWVSDARAILAKLEATP